jgi:2'-5' RNA ligase
MSERRLFIALKLSDTVKDALAQLQTSIDHVRWVDPDQMHLTLFYLGQTDQATQELIETRLRPLAKQYAPMMTNIQGTGVFPNKEHPKVLWADVERADKLMNLQQDISNEMGALDFESDYDSYHPHITLGRCNEPAAASRVIQQWCEEYNDRPFGEEQFGQFYLVQSKLHPEGARYTYLKEFPLTKGNRNT